MGPFELKICIYTLVVILITIAVFFLYLQIYLRSLCSNIWKRLTVLSWPRQMTDCRADDLRGSCSYVPNICFCSVEVRTFERTECLSKLFEETEEIRRVNGWMRTLALASKIPRLSGPAHISSSWVWNWTLWKLGFLWTSSLILRSCLRIGWQNALPLLLKYRSWLVSSSLPLKSFHDLALSYVVLSIFPLNSAPSLSGFISLPALVVIWFGGNFFVTLGTVSRYCPQSNPLSAFIQMPVGGKGLVVFLGLSGTHPESLAAFVSGISSSRRPLLFCRLFFAGVINGPVATFSFIVIIRMWSLGSHPVLVIQSIPCL